MLNNVMGLRRGGGSTFYSMERLTKLSWYAVSDGADPYKYPDRVTKL